MQDQNKKEEEIRKEFFLQVASFSDDYHHDVEPYSMQKIADFWLAKMSSQRKALLEEIKNALPKEKVEYGEAARWQLAEVNRMEYAYKNEGYNLALSDCLSVVIKLIEEKNV